MKHISEGHRKRLRNRFLQSGLDGFLDYEIVELLLTLGTPRKDCKKTAKEAIRKFKGLRGVLDASLDDLQTVKGIGPSNAFGVKLFQAMSRRYSEEKIFPKIPLTKPSEVAGYLKELLGREKKEHFMVLYLNTRKQLIHKETISVGILDMSIVHPREVFEPAVKHLASGVIVAHNHPSGSPEPSNEDVEITGRLARSGKILGITLIDHLIITNSDYYSFKQKGMI